MPGQVGFLNGGQERLFLFHFNSNLIEDNYLLVSAPVDLVIFGNIGII